MMKRGEIWWVSFDPSVGGRVRHKRPAVIVSNDAANKFLDRVQVVPLAGKTAPVYPSEALVHFDGRSSKAQADQLATVSKSRLFRRAGPLTPDDMHKIDEAIKVHLGLA